MQVTRVLAQVQSFNMGDLRLATVSDWSQLEGGVGYFVHVLGLGCESVCVGLCVCVFPTLLFFKFPELSGFYLGI